MCILLKVAESLHLTVFDTKTSESGSSDGRVRKVEKRWLGSVQFPFTTLYTAAAKGRIDGVFAIDAPPHIIGYSHAHASGKAGKGKEGKDAGRESAIVLYVVTFYYIANILGY